ncbi:MAG: methyltransferase domain-containing protein [Anaerolineae bacterium]|nr:methyltransferase domain-containing protein [Anaerolineae bacterium]
MSNEQEAIQALYAQDTLREWERMERHSTEFAVTLRALAEYLPPAPARVLDCGGGPGRYAIELTRRGYAVTLFDLTPELLALAEKKAVEAGIALAGYEQGTATDLSRFPDASFDAVLVMGPLYHLLEAADRRQVAAEAYRVVRPGGIVALAFITRYAGHHDALARYPHRALEQVETYTKILETGQLLPEEDRIGFVAYFTHPTEVDPLCREAGFKILTTLGVEGLASMHEAGLSALDAEGQQFWLDFNYRVAADPSIHGAVEHLLAICRKPRWRAVLREIAQQLNAEDLDYRGVGGTALALRGLNVPVNDIDLEMPVEAVYRFQELFTSYTADPIARRENENVYSHIGRFDFDGLKVEVMADLHWRRGERWLASFLSTEATVDLDGIPVRVLALEEEALAYLRRGRLDRAALCLPQCDTPRFLALLQAAIQAGNI